MAYQLLVEQLSVFETEHINGGLSWKEFRNRLKKVSAAASAKDIE